MVNLWEKGMKTENWAIDFTVGNDFLLDQKLVKYDCLASIAHAEMLRTLGIITGPEKQDIEHVLKEIIGLDKRGEFIIRKEDEDSHTAIENYLTKKLGDTGKKIHTLRSRNDQVLTALRMYEKDQIKAVISCIEGFKKAMKSFDERYGKIEIPGYTHTRKAMPSSVGLWINSFSESMDDNKKLLEAVFGIVDQSPLGTGAGYGLPEKIDRELEKKLLGFSKVQGNPLYCQNSRGKMEASILHALSQITLDLNRMASDIILFSAPEFGFFMLDDSICTGSSIMPQKKNPDVLEIIRAKYHEISAFEYQIKSLTANLISGYHRDLQLTKEPLMKGFEIADGILKAMTKVIIKLRVDADKCGKAMMGELFAAREAYELAKQGAPFRDAYKSVSRKYHPLKK